MKCFKCGFEKLAIGDKKFRFAKVNRRLCKCVNVISNVPVNLKSPLLRNLLTKPSERSSILNEALFSALYDIDENVIDLTESPSTSTGTQNNPELPYLRDLTSEIQSAFPNPSTALSPTPEIPDEIFTSDIQSDSLPHSDDEYQQILTYLLEIAPSTPNLEFDNEIPSTSFDNQLPAQIPARVPISTQTTPNNFSIGVQTEQKPDNVSVAVQTEESVSHQTSSTITDQEMNIISAKLAILEKLEVDDTDEIIQDFAKTSNYTSFLDGVCSLLKSRVEGVTVSHICNKLKNQHKIVPQKLLNTLKKKCASVVKTNIFKFKRRP